MVKPRPRQTQLKVEIQNSGVRETLKAFNRLPKAQQAALRDRTMQLAETLAVRVRQAGQREGRQARPLSVTVKARRDRIPIIEVGGTAKVGASKVPAWRVLLGSEFGGNRRTGWYGISRFTSSTGRQFKPHLGRGSYWFFDAVYREQAVILKAWLAIANDVEQNWRAD